METPAQDIASYRDSAISAATQSDVLTITVLHDLSSCPLSPSLNLQRPALSPRLSPNCMPQAYTPLPSADTPSAPTRRRRKIPFRYLFGFVLFLAIPITWLLVLAVSTKDSGLMRLCLPIQLHGISTKLHKQFACSPLPSRLAANLSTSTTLSPSPTASVMSASIAQGPVQPGRIADFLLSQKEAFLADLASNNAKGWTVVSGNEAGDLDSLASGIGFAYLDNTLNTNRSVPLTLTPRSKMTLRPENLLALERAHIPVSVLLHPEDLPGGTEGLISAGATVGLVDHNRLLPRFGDESVYNKVSSIVDHHEDEGVSLEADPRIVKVPTGSTSSLVTNYFVPQWKAIISSPAGANAGPPPELATLLLSALLIDTQGLKSGGKATLNDYDAANFLYGISSLPQIQAVNATTTISPALTEFADELVTAKYNVTGLSIYELLERDYKQYAWDTASARFPLINVGLSTVPVSLEDQLKLEDLSWAKYLAVADASMIESGVDIAGVLTTYKSAKGKSKRELLIIVRAGGGLPDLAAAEEVMTAIANGLEAEVEVFGMSPWMGKKGTEKEMLAIEAETQLNSDTRVARAWKQENHRSTRKQLAPAMHAIISKLQ